MARKGENIYKRKDGRWEGRYKCGYDDFGKSKYRSIYGKSYQNVRKQLLKFKLDAQIEPVSCSMTVKILFDEWLSAVKIRTKESTYAGYKMKVEKHILPYFGNMRYDMLTAKMLHNFIDEKLKSGLSPKYVSDIVVIFKSMAKYISGIYKFYNPIADVALPKVSKPEMKLFDDCQQKTLCKYLIKNLNNTSLCILISLYTGLRIGEICGLKWSDIDFEKSILTVRRTIQRICSDNNEKSTKIIIDTPKSSMSQRSIPVPDFIMKLLKKFNSEPDSYILSGSNKITEPRTLQYRFKAILKKADLPSINYHSLRHMFATNCVRAGFDIKTLSEILGHSVIETTLRLYVHSSMEHKIRCMSMLKPAA